MAVALGNINGSLEKEGAEWNALDPSLFLSSD